MGQKEYVSRLKADYRKVFDTPEGKHVLMDLYTHLKGKKSSMEADGNPFKMAFNEGQRAVWLKIMAQLRVEDIDMNRAYVEFLAERQREEMET